MEIVITSVCACISSWLHQTTQYYTTSPLVRNTGHWRENKASEWCLAGKDCKTSKNLHLACWTQLVWLVRHVRCWVVSEEVLQRRRSQGVGERGRLHPLLLCHHHNESALRQAVMRDMSDAESSPKRYCRDEDPRGWGKEGDYTPCYSVTTTMSLHQDRQWWELF